MGKASQNSRGAPLGLPERLPQNHSLPTLLLCALTYTSDFTGAFPHHHLSLWKRDNLQLQLIKFLGVTRVFWFTNPSDGSLTCLTGLPGLLQLCIWLFSLPAGRGTGSLRYSCSIEPLGELEIVRIELVEDFIAEPMLAVKFPHPLYCILGSLLINIVGV